MLPVEGSDPEIPGWGGVIGAPAGDGQGKAQLAMLVGAQVLLAKVYQNEFLIFGRRRVFAGQWGETGQCGQVAGHLEREAGAEMAAVQAIKTQNLRPVVAEKLPGAIAFLEFQAIPGDGRVAGVDDLAEVVNFFGGGCGAGACQAEGEGQAQKESGKDHPGLPGAVVAGIDMDEAVPRVIADSAAA